MEPLLDLLMRSTQCIGVSPFGRLTTWIEAVAKYLDKAEARNRVLRILWFVSTVVLMIVTAVVAPLLSWIWSWKVGAFFGVALWSIFFGATGLLFLPPKAMTAVFGGILGIGVSEVSSGAGLIASANKAITELARQIGAVVTPNVGTPDPFIGILVWTFVLLVLLVSLPAFFAKEESRADQRGAPADPPEKPRAGG